MAEFPSALKITLNFEGGWVNNPMDKYGGETFRGVSRKNWPNWEGWKIIDSYKKDFNFPGILYLDDRLISLVESFYRKEFWYPIEGDLIHSQDIANKIFDMGVLCGVHTSSFYAQKTAIDVTKYILTVDGVIGSKSLEIINQCDPVKFLEVFNDLIWNYLQTRKTFEDFKDGWDKRVFS